MVTVCDEEEEGEDGDVLLDGHTQSPQCEASRVSEECI